MMPTRMSSLPAAAPGRGEVRDRSKDCRRRKPLRFAALFIGFGNGFRLPLYYLDVETTGDDPQQDRIVTVQYQALADDLTPTGLFQAFADKESGARVPKMYREGLFQEIIDYVTRERDAAMDLLKESREVIGDLGDRRRRPLHKGEAKP